MCLGVTFPSSYPQRLTVMTSSDSQFCHLFSLPMKFGGENWKARVVEEVKAVAEINSTVSLLVPKDVFRTRIISSLPVSCWS